MSNRRRASTVADAAARLRGLTTSQASTLLKMLVVAVLLLWPLFFRNLYGMSVMSTAGLFTVVTISVGLILGQAGQLSFAHSAFYGIGAYTAGILSVKLGVPTLVALLAGTALPGVLAVVIGRPVLKLRYFYLALATIGLGQIIVVLINQFPTLTGASNGFAGCPPLSVFGFEFDTHLRKYYLIWVAAILILLFTSRLLKNRVGRSLRAIATSEIACSTLGIRTARWKLLTFVTSAMFCGFAGCLFAFTVSAFQPSSFGFSASILPIVMMLVGGDRSIWGTVIGAIAITWLINGSISIQNYSGLMFALILIVVLLFIPRGILGLLTPEREAWAVNLLRRSYEGKVVESSADPESGCPSTERDTPVAPRQSTTPRSEGTGGEAVTDVPSPAARRISAATSGEPVLRVQSLSVHFGGVKAVDGVSFDVPEGEITAIIGPNGAGKTTVFNTVSRIQQLTAGRIWFDGKDVTGIAASEMARLGVARTFQNLRLFSTMNAIENVLVGCHRHEKSGFWGCGLGFRSQRREERASRDKAMAALAALGIEEYALSPVTSLPYGQQRKVEIARALASEPRLLMLDEPAAGMNAGERADLIDRILLLSTSGITILLVEHDMSLVMGISNNVHVLNYGRLIASGSPQEVQSDEEVIKAYLGEKKRDSDIRVSDSRMETTRRDSEDVLVLDQVSTCYGAIEAIRGVSFSVRESEVVAVLGANGAGKTTMLNTISGLLRPTGGVMSYKGKDLIGLAPHVIAGLGVCQVPEGRLLFPTLTVEDNLVMGTSGIGAWRRTIADDMAYVYELFPVLGSRRTQVARTLSGGEQQMLAIGRALMGRPKLLLLDEPSMGLAPLVVERIFEALEKLNKDGLPLLMVEQNAEMALSVADRALVLQTGKVVLTGTAEELRLDDRVRASYLGHNRGA